MRPVSPSGVAMWRTCPFKFYLHYSGAKPLPPHPDFAEPLEFGKAIHEVIKTYYELMPSSVTPGTLRTIMSAAFKRAWPAKLMHLRDRAERQLLNFLKFEERRITWGIDPRPLAVEKEFTKGIVHGVVDALFKAPNGEVIVVDWKSGRGRSRLTEDIVFQMNVYLYLTGASRAYPIFLEWGEWYEVRPTIDVETVVREIVEARSYPKRRGPHCQSCEYQLACLGPERGLTPAFSFYVR